MLKVLIALVTAAAVFVASGAGHAASVTAEIKSGLVCDTADQVESFIALPSGMPVSAALAKINAQAGDPHACVIATVAVTAAAPERTVAAADGRLVEILSVEVIGAADGAGDWHLFPPKTYFMLRPVKGRAI